jgi:hypothetical protein
MDSPVALIETRVHASEIEKKRALKERAEVLTGNMATEAESGT